VERPSEAARWKQVEGSAAQHRQHSREEIAMTNTPYRKRTAPLTTKIVALAIAGGLACTAGAATTGWNVTAPGAYAYTDTTYWVGGTVNDTFDSSLVLTDNSITGVQTLTFDADPIIVSLGFTFDSPGTATNITYGFTLQGTGATARSI